MAFPNVPNVPGVPAVPRLAGALSAVVQLLTADSQSLFAGLDGPVWGLFLNNAPVVTAETVVSFDFKKGSTITSAPIEGGGFESYNKVRKPFDVRIRFATGGSASDRAALLATVDEVCDSLDLVDAVTPETIYPSVNPLYYDYRRTAEKGLTLLQVDVFCEQVRVRASSTFTTTNTGAPAAASSSATGTTFNDRFPTTAPIVAPLSPSAAPVVNGGTVQATPAAPGQFDLSQALP